MVVLAVEALKLLSWVVEGTQVGSCIHLHLVVVLWFCGLAIDLVGCLMLHSAAC